MHQDSPAVAYAWLNLRPVHAGGARLSMPGEPVMCAKLGGVRRRAVLVISRGAVPGPGTPAPQKAGPGTAPLYGRAPSLEVGVPPDDLPAGPHVAGDPADHFPVDLRLITPEQLGGDGDLALDGGVGGPPVGTRVQQEGEASGQQDSEPSQSGQ